MQLSRPRGVPGKWSKIPTAVKRDHLQPVRHSRGPTRNGSKGCNLPRSPQPSGNHRLLAHSGRPEWRLRMIAVLPSRCSAGAKIDARSGRWSLFPGLAVERRLSSKLGPSRGDPCRRALRPIRASKAPVCYVRNTWTSSRPLCANRGHSAAVLANGSNRPEAAVRRRRLGLNHVGGLSRLTMCRIGVAYWRSGMPRWIVDRPPTPAAAAHQRVMSNRRFQRSPGLSSSPKT